MPRAYFSGKAGYRTFNSAFLARATSLRTLRSTPARGKSVAFYKLTNTELTGIPETTFRDTGFYERQGLQRVLRDSIQVASPDTYAAAWNLVALD